MSCNGLKLKNPFFISQGITAHLTDTHLKRYLHKLEEWASVNLLKFNKAK